MRIKTYTPTPEDIQREWYVVDAKDKTLGRLATEVARILRGKHKPIFAPHMDTGDYVIIINCEKIRVTGDKLDSKVYYRHSGYPGGIKSVTLRQQLDKFPDRVLHEAVRGMLPKNKLGRAMIKKLKIYSGDKHPHQAQQPKVLDL
ncbi:MAG TPA: 50S ribosomal protein L13 [Aggregatilinea sp.]|jgi:large subunit ribosomal protein L13|nr:50S ribosomal protein L13 [Aggregatilinea sp.]HML22150.1 50S ribosomal protein L13 [Aggregatilinea sp.]